MFDFYIFKMFFVIYLLSDYLLHFYLFDTKVKADKREDIVLVASGIQNYSIIIFFFFVLFNDNI